MLLFRYGLFGSGTTRDLLKTIELPFIFISNIYVIGTFVSVGNMAHHVFIRDECHDLSHSIVD